MGSRSPAATPSSAPRRAREARALARALEAARAAVASGERGRDRLLALATREIAGASLAKLDYAELRDPGSLAPTPERLTGDALLALAVYFPKPGGDAVRLIDNCVLRIAKE